MGEPSVGEQTLPTDCGLAIALPQSLEEIEAALAGGPFRDYVARAASFGNASAIWSAGFAKVAAAAGALADQSRSLGVEVMERASLPDIARLFAKCSVVTVIAHWRGPEIVASDLRKTADELVHRIATDPSETASLLRAGLPRDALNELSPATGSTQQSSRLAELLDRRLARGPLLAPPPQGTEWHLDAETLYHTNRELLDGWWPEAIVPGNRLELADGLHDAASIAACVNPHWRGVADLSNCRSAQLGDFIKQSRDDRTVILTAREVNPISRMGVLTALYEMLAKGGYNYLEVRRALATALLTSATGA